MNERLTYGVSLVLGVLSLFLLIANVALIDSNRHQQDTASQRQAEISKGTSLVALNQNLVQALAEISFNGNDTGARDLLAAQGITVKANPKTATADKPSPAK